MTSLEQYGWNSSWQTVWQRQNLDHHTPARVIAEYGSKYILATPSPISASLSGALAHKLPAYDMPKVGDWVAVEKTDYHLSTIHAVLPRTSEIVRGKISSRNDRQVIAANVDLAFIVQPLDQGFSPERLERYLFQLSNQSIEVVILLNKSDTTTEIGEKKAALQHLNVKVIAISAFSDQDMHTIERLIPPEKTAVFMGSSGAGKSTLTNKLLGVDRQRTQETRIKDSKGRHTTVHRELFVLPSGGLVIDMPGVREVQLWGSLEDLYESFPEIATAVRSCHFPNCTHTVEKGCAVREGLQSGAIDSRRYEHFKVLQAEVYALEEKRRHIEKRRENATREQIKRIRLRNREKENNVTNQDWD